MLKTFARIIAASAAVVLLSAPAVRAEVLREVPSYYQHIDDLDYSAVSITATILGNQSVRRAMNDMAQLGGHLCRIAYVTHSFDKVSFELRFIRQGGPFGPPPAPWHGSFRVNMQAPADGSLQVSNITHVFSSPTNPPDGWLHN
jgi:hypothetical protein